MPYHIGQISRMIEACSCREFWTIFRHFESEATIRINHIDTPISRVDEESTHCCGSVVSGKCKECQ